MGDEKKKAKDKARVTLGNKKRAEASINGTGDPKNAGLVFAPGQKRKVIAKVAKEQGINADAMRKPSRTLCKRTLSRRTRTR